MSSSRFCENKHFAGIPPGSAVKTRFGHDERLRSVWRPVGLLRILVHHEALISVEIFITCETRMAEEIEVIVWLVYFWSHDLATRVVVHALFAGCCAAIAVVADNLRGRRVEDEHRVGCLARKREDIIRAKGNM